MKKNILLISLAILVLLILFGPKVWSWGFYGHRKINEMAVFTLPPGMIGFYKKHISFISKHAVDADRRRFSDPEESCRHYFDSEFYDLQSFDSVPTRWEDAVAKYGIDSLRKHGIVPWHILHTFYRLTFAFRENKPDLILHYSSDLGHYVADAHVPLHTTRNYNGQFSNQEGIHAFWESRIPELYAESYDYFCGRASYIDNPSKVIWSALKASILASDSVLLFEAKLNSTFPSDLKYSYETKGSKIQRNYSEAYSYSYQKMLGNMIERRMIESVRVLGGLWYTAWVNAGQPDLQILENQTYSDSFKKAISQQELEWKRLDSLDSH